MDYCTAFILGLIGSLHCAGMCGPLALALPGRNASPTRFFFGRLAYNLGRLITYCALGLLFGAIGKSLFLAGLQRWLSIALGLVLLLGLLGSRRLALWQPLSSFVNRLKSRMAILLKSNSLSSVAFLGLLNGLLPCGLVYVACAGATVKGSLLGALLYMAAFGVGTFPMMLAISLSGRLVPFSLRLKLQRAIPVSVFVLGTLLILRGMSLGVPYLSPGLATGSCCHK